jgi:hypothetical protein
MLRRFGREQAFGQPDQRRPGGERGIVVGGVGIVVDEIPAAHIVDVAIDIVIPVIGGLAQVAPDLAGQIRMGVINAAVYGPFEIEVSKEPAESILARQ